MGSAKQLSRQESSVKKCLKFPILILIRAKDLYIESLTGGASHMAYGNAMGCPTPVTPTVPRKSDSKQVHIKDATSRRKRNDTELPRTKVVGKPVSPAKTMSIGRIDEDEEYEYGSDNFGLLKSPLLSVKV